MPITTFPDGSGTSIWGGIAGTLSNQTDLQDALDAKANVTCLVYTALLTQTGTDAPVATVLENTLGGTVVWFDNGTWGAMSGYHDDQFMALALANYVWMKRRGPRAGGLGLMPVTGFAR